MSFIGTLFSVLLFSSVQPGHIARRGARLFYHQSHKERCREGDNLLQRRQHVEPQPFIQPIIKVSATGEQGYAPQPWNEFRDTKRYFAENKAVWRALEDAQATGKVRVIGVSNFLQDDLENLLSDCRIQPMVNQILLHISNTDHNLLNFCREQHIQVEAYSPIAHGEALKNPVIAQMAKKYGVSAAQLCVRYVLQLGAVALPKTADPQHMEENAAVDFVLTPEDMAALMQMEHIADYGEFSFFPVFSGKKQV